MRRKTKDTLNTITDAFFEIAATGAVITAALVLSQGRTGSKLFKCFAQFSVWEIKRMLRRQKLRGRIEYDEEDEKAPILLTENGFIRATRDIFCFSEGVKWDHFWRLISFDIPEQKGVRKRFQRFLQSIGCYKIHKSLYAHPFECKEVIVRFASSLRISSNVTVYTIPNLDLHEKSARVFYFDR